eukprot:356232-Chlamydomonas_euryale.AAC.14
MVLCVCKTGSEQLASTEAIAAHLSKPGTSCRSSRGAPATSAASSATSSERCALRRASLIRRASLRVIWEASASLRVACASQVLGPDTCASQVLGPDTCAC